MDVSPAERDARLRERIRIMDSGQFEQLVFELAQREFPDVRRLSPPDGGADTGRPAADHRQAEVWQAKHYAGGINWDECRNSLAASIARWTPSKVTFVLPRDLSETTEGTFQTKLVDHPDAVESKVSVDLWNLSELIRRLNAAPDLRNRFFPDTESTVDQILRGVNAGGKLETGADLVERARTLSTFAEQRDRDFTYQVIASSGAPAPEWPDPPYLQVRLSDGSNEVQLIAWPRESADIAAPSFSFTVDPAGDKARTDAIRAWGRGEQAAVSDGGQLRFRTPELVKEIFPTAEFGRGGTVYMPAPEPFSAILEITHPDETLTFTFEARVVPPRTGAFGAIAGFIGSVFIEANFESLLERRARATFTLSALFESSATKNLEAAKLMLAWSTQDRVSLRTTQMYREGIGGQCQETVSAEVREEMQARVEFYTDVVFIEDRLDVDLPIPDEMDRSDVAAIATVAEVLRTGRGTATFEDINVPEIDPSLIPRLIDDISKQSPKRQLVSYELFGRDVILGEGDYELPRLKIVDIIPHGTVPTAPARVVIGADGMDQMSFTLVQ